MYGTKGAKAGSRGNKTREEDSPFNIFSKRGQGEGMPTREKGCAREKNDSVPKFRNAFEKGEH